MVSHHGMSVASFSGRRITEEDKKGCFSERRILAFSRRCSTGLDNEVAVQFDESFVSRLLYKACGAFDHISGKDYAKLRG